MAAPQSVEDDFSNRRMTRSAFKRKFGLQENDQEQQQSKIQQKLEGGEEVKKSLTGEALVELHRRRKARFVPFTPELDEYYSKVVCASEGFDCGNLPSHMDAIGVVQPLRELKGALPELEKASKAAIATYNKQNNTKYRFVKVIRANYMGVAGFIYYITFVAEDKDVGTTKNFQARVHFGVNRKRVLFCRLELPPKGSARERAKLELLLEKKVKPEEDPVKPEEPPPASYFHWEEFSKHYKEMNPNAPVHGRGRACAEAWESLPETERARYVEKAEKKMAKYHRNLEAYNKRMAGPRRGR